MRQLTPIREEALTLAADLKERQRKLRLSLPISGSEI